MRAESQQRRTHLEVHVTGVRRADEYRRQPPGGVHRRRQRCRESIRVQQRRGAGAVYRQQGRQAGPVPTDQLGVRRTQRQHTSHRQSPAGILACRKVPARNRPEHGHEGSLRRRDCRRRRIRACDTLRARSELHPGVERTERVVV